MTVVNYPTTNVMHNDSENITLQKILQKRSGNPPPPIPPDHSSGGLTDDGSALLTDDGSSILIP